MLFVVAVAAVVAVVAAAVAVVVVAVDIVAALRRRVAARRGAAHAEQVFARAVREKGCGAPHPPSRSNVLFLCRAIENTFLHRTRKQKNVSPPR